MYTDDYMPMRYNNIQALHVLKMKHHTTTSLLFFLISRRHVRTSNCVPVQKVPLETEPDDKTQIRPQDSEAMPKAPTAP